MAFLYSAGRGFTFFCLKKQNVQVKVYLGIKM